MVRKRTVLCVLFTFFLATAGCSRLINTGTGSSPGASAPEAPAASPTGPQATPTQQQPVIGGLKVLNAALVTNQYGNVYVVGYAKNVAGHDLRYAQLQPKFYDSSGTRLGTGLANINNLAAGETWRFEAVYPSMDAQNVASATLGGMRLTFEENAPSGDEEAPTAIMGGSENGGGEYTASGADSELTPMMGGAEETTVPPSTPTPTATSVPSQYSTELIGDTHTASDYRYTTRRPPRESHTIVIIGGSAEDKLNYRFGVSGTIERSGENFSAPIKAESVTMDPDIDLIADDGSRVSGRIGGGGDAYRFTGDITSADFEGDAEIYIDGEQTDPASVTDQ